jgi:hypothetical protein
MALTERQQKAQDLARDLEQMGAWCLTPLPLDPDAKGLRVQILDADRDRVVTAICEAHYIPSKMQAHPRFTTSGLIPASLFEIAIEKERPSIVDDRPKVSSDIAEAAKREERQQAAKFISAFRKSAGLDK